MFWMMHSGIIAAMAMVFARYAAFFVPLGDRGIRAVAVAAILAHLGDQLRRREAGQQRVQTAFTIGKVLAVVLIVVVGFAVGSRLPDHFSRVRAHGRPPLSPQQAFCSR